MPQLARSGRRLELLLADRARRRALGLLQLAAAAPPVRPWEHCSSPPTPAPPMPTPADDPAQLLAAVLTYRPQPWAWPRPRPLYLPHPRRRMPRLRGVVRGSKPWLKPATIIQN